MAGLGPIPQLVEWMTKMTKDYMSPQQVCALLTFVEFCKRQEVPIFALAGTNKLRIFLTEIFPFST
jgi:hypothetical protein